jgi:hypothetical protein
MRIIYVAVACLAVVAAAGGIRANVVGIAATGIDPSAAGPEIPRDMTGGSSGTRRAPALGESAAGVGRTLGQPKTHDNAVRLAQIGASTAPPEVDTGNPVAAPYKWAGLLQIPAPTQQSPNLANLCTGQFITPNVVLTAGHCIKDLPSVPTGPWPDPTKGTFWLQWQNKVGVSFNVVCALANPLWTLPSNYSSLTAAQQNDAMNAAFEHDFAMVLVNGTSPTGVMPYALDWKGKISYAYRIGYPANILDGSIIQRVPGYVFFSDAIPLGGYSLPNVVVQWGPVTDATQGMSGGAWVANLNPAEGPNNNILIAVTSFGPVNAFNAPVLPGGTFASYLTAAEFNPLLVSVSNGCK